MSIFAADKIEPGYQNIQNFRFEDFELVDYGPPVDQTADRGVSETAFCLQFLQVIP